MDQDLPLIHPYAPVTPGRYVTPGGGRHNIRPAEMRPHIRITLDHMGCPALSSPTRRTPLTSGLPGPPDSSWNTSTNARTNPPPGSGCSGCGSATRPPSSASSATPRHRTCWPRPTAAFPCCLDGARSC
ncbi:DUF6420 family protein [Streptomyces turgidiscabies]|uniref:DUF6420 family protein n=1 Tax=Streptomyces turgidiscabies TaxID=85558 RepID=UPI001F42A4FB|nr:DUF6420 family protein [Streptomyces turgidiscabies]MDX3499734.1 DUF6420 family protein [Streptomyces turgidiscabies]